MMQAPINPQSGTELRLLQSADSAARQSQKSQQKSSFAESLEGAAEHRDSVPTDAKRVEADPAGTPSIVAEQSDPVSPSSGNDLPPIAADLAGVLPPVDGRLAEAGDTGVVGTGIHAEMGALALAGQSPAGKSLNHLNATVSTASLIGANGQGSESAASASLAQAAGPALIGELSGLDVPGKTGAEQFLTRLQADSQASASLLVASSRIQDTSPAGVGPSVLESINSASAAKSALAPIDIPPTDARWGDAVAHRAMVAIQRGLQQADIRITPARLGPIEMQIQLHDDRASVTMISPHAAVRELLENATPRLRELLEQQGLSLQQNLVSDQSPRHSSGHADDGNETEHAGLIGHADELPDELPAQRQLGLVDRYA